MNAKVDPIEKWTLIANRLTTAFQRYKAKHRGNAPNVAFVDLRAYEELRKLPSSFPMMKDQNVRTNRIQFCGMIVLPVGEVADLCHVSQVSVEP